MVALVLCLECVEESAMPGTIQCVIFLDRTPTVPTRLLLSKSPGFLTPVCIDQANDQGSKGVPLL